MNAALSDFLYEDEEKAVKRLLDVLRWDKALAAKVEARAADLVRRIRSSKGAGGQVEAFLRQYPLSSEEGLSLMTLAEALLRIPDKDTANALIRDKVAAVDWLHHVGTDGIGGGGGWMNRLTGIGLALTRKTLGSKLAALGEPVIREILTKGLRMMGQQFVLGEDIDDALRHARAFEKRGYRMSYDILGEGARTSAQSAYFFNSYCAAAERIGREAPGPGMSVKLSALHPRYSFAQKDICVPEITAQLVTICEIAAKHNIPLIIDAEESERLEISLDILAALMAQEHLRGWDGLGLAVQAYQKRALPLIGHLSRMAQNAGRRLRVRLVKGAYWDSEIKRAQANGFTDYPVFTRKANTDLSYLACAQELFAHKDRLYPMFGTHNAHTLAAIVEMGHEAAAQFEFQRLHGMGEALYDLVLEDKLAPVGIYAPVGPHEDLLAYLVRRLLENGANTSFLNQLMNPRTSIDHLIRSPVEAAMKAQGKRHPGIPLPGDLYRREGASGRENAASLDLNDARSVERLYSDMKAFDVLPAANSIVGGQAAQTPDVDQAFALAGKGFAAWSQADAETRASCLEKCAGLMEANHAELIALIAKEGKRTLPDALSELREAVDFCRYYAARGRELFHAGGQALAGPTGESNHLTMQGRGVFACISPWNFPLAIFTGQVAAALMAGNAVICKPAAQTPVTAMRAVQLMHQAGVPKDVLHFIIGGGRTVGAAIIAHPDVAGVAFTGSTETAWSINRTLAAKNGPIVPLIAETGGLNAMFVDSSALPEHVIDDVMISAFGSAGQRCSSLRLLCVQEDCADKIIHLLQGAMRNLRLGDPFDLKTDIAPVIDQGALEALETYQSEIETYAKRIAITPFDEALKSADTYFAPCAYEIPDLSRFNREIFGPVLHVLRYRRSEIDELIDQLNAKGFGLTLGVQSRIDGFQLRVAERMKAGNIYINRSMIGAVVGTQPFGGMGLSGTGPKAGGPHYLPRFATEKVVSINTSAVGGNASLVSLDD